MWLQSRKVLLAAAAFFLLSAAAFSLDAADAESRDFDAAAKSFRDGFHQRAEKLFAEFVAAHPGSPRIAQALLFQSQSSAAQKNFQAAIDLLATNMANAAGIADKFQFATATNFALLVAKYTNSSLRLEATVGEARARFELKQWGRVADLLQNPAGVFQQAASHSPENSTV